MLPVPALFRRVDWWAFTITTVLSFIGYFLTLAPNQTLEDSGELATGSFYAGIPHPPGYPVWTLFTWVFTRILPIGNIAWRVGVSSAVAGAVACGLLALVVSRGSSMMIQGLAEIKDLERKWEDALCLVSGFVAGMLMAFNGYFWSQAVIVEVYTISVLSLMIVLVCLLHFAYAPQKRSYLYWAMFAFGICFTNHQTLIVAAVGIEILIAAAHPKMGRDLFLGNSVLFVLAILMKINGKLTMMDGNMPLFVIFNVIGILSIILCGWLAVQTKGLGTETASVVLMGVCWILGAAFYFYMPIASMSTPPLNWGYPRTVEGFWHALQRGQYEKANPANIVDEPDRFAGQVLQYFSGAAEEFNVVYLMIGVIPFVLLGYRLYREGAAKDLRWLGIVNGSLVVLFLIAAYVSQSGKMGHWDARGLVHLIWFFIGGLVCADLLLLIHVMVRYLHKPERAWMFGLSAIYLGLALLLLVLLNPAPDRQSQSLNKVFFTSSHVMISIWIGYGIAILGAYLATHYQALRNTALAIGAGAGAIALYALASVKTMYWLEKFTGIFGVALAAVFVISLLLKKDRAPLFSLVGLCALMPIYSISGHWWENEQRGHLFGYWFGHDMFTPPFKGPDGKLSYDKTLREELLKGTNAAMIYPEMDRNTVLFGGTDPGRFCPTYMIYCESFIPPSARQSEDPAFDRRDVYIITQNALADATYLRYIRAHYNRSREKDQPFFTEFFHTDLLAPLDTFFTDLGAKIEKGRRERGVYPPKEILTPTIDDSQQAFQEYIADAQRRLDHDRRAPNEPRQIKPGEQVEIRDGRVQVSGQVAVMAINGLLTKNIFDKNPDHEFYVEESFPLDWMFPYLTPFGIIMKINRKPIPEMTEEMVRRDHQFWTDYSERMIGNWITYDTPVSNICAFAERVYLKRDLRDFKGDPRFVRDDDAQKAFSKLRSAQAGLYTFRINGQRSPAERNRMIKEADFAFRQAFAFCPYSPEAVFRYINLLMSLGRIDDAIMIVKTSKKLDPENGAMNGLVEQLEGMRRQSGAASGPGGNNFQEIFNRVGATLSQGQTQQAIAMLDQILNMPTANPQEAQSVALSVAQAFQQLNNFPHLETAMKKITTLTPESPEAWYDLAAVEAVLNKPEDLVQALGKSLSLSAKRLKDSPKAANAKDLLLVAKTDPRFAPYTNNAELKKLLQAK